MSNEIIKLFCETCKKEIKGTYQKLFGDIPSLICLPKMVCKCGGDIIIDFTSSYE